MIARVLTAALAAGALAAMVATVLQVFATTPLILRAEVFERHASLQAEGGASPGHTHGAPAAAAGGEAAASAFSLSRLGLTGLATLVSGVGYALLLSAAMLAAGATFGTGATLAWAMGGFLAASLAPAMGLPPELPGMGGEHLAERQVWWLATAALTAAGLYLAARSRNPLLLSVALVAILAPHLVGAPQAGDGGAVPASLAAQFASRSLGVALLFWLALGFGLGQAWKRLAPDPGIPAGVMAR